MIFFVNLIFIIFAALVISKVVIKVSANSKPALVFLFASIILPLNFPLVFKRLSAGMEMAIAYLLLSLLLLVFCSEKVRQYNHWFRFREGLLLGALTLTRIDYIIFAISFAVLIIFVWRKRWFKPLAIFAFGYSVLVGTYILFAFLCLDSIIPVSFLAKQYYSSLHIASLTLFGHVEVFLKNLPQIWLYPFSYSLYGFYWRWGSWGLGIVTLIVACCVAILGYLGRIYLRDLFIRSTLMWFSLAVIVHATLLAWSRIGFISSAFFWYYTPELLLIMVCLILLFTASEKGFTSLGRIASIVLSLLFLSSTVLYSMNGDIESYASYRKAIDSVQMLTPTSAIIGSWDAGYNAYWLQPRTVINLDGMVNSRDYLEKYVKPDDLVRYLSDQQIEYLLNMVPDTATNRSNIEISFFRDPSISRACYDILAELSFERQNLIVYLLKYKCQKQ
ncbi:MAG: hypothetical protein ACYC6R_17920 [Anaerolineales bacterium]